MKKILLILSIFVACIMSTMLVSCDKDEKLDDYGGVNGTSRNDFGKKDIPVSEVRIVSLRQNAYSMTNMRAAYNQLVSAGQIAPMTIRPTHLYIRINVRDSADLTRLVEDTTIELFNYPLESELSGDGYYIPPASESNIVYTVVPIDYDLQGLSYGLIDTCCIPDNDCSDDMWLVEWTALVMTNNVDSDDKFVLPSRCDNYPSGRISVKNTETGNYDGVRRIKVVINVLVKYTVAYTDDDGNYNSGLWFLTKPNYTIKFKNKSKFWIWGNHGLLLPAYITYKKQSKSGVDIGFSNRPSWGWYLSTVNNATSIYYEQLCGDFGIVRPVDNLRIWATPIDVNGWSASTPMFRHFLNMGTFCDFISTYHIFSGVAMAGLILPDMLVYMPNSTTGEIYSTMFHELAHASHYTQVGNGYWSHYLRGIIDNIGYGTDTNATNYGFIGIGEMWGYFAELMLYNHYWSVYGSHSSTHQDTTVWRRKWYSPQIPYELSELPIKQLDSCHIFQYLTARDTSHKRLWDTLTTTFPDFETDISDIFSKYGFNY